MRENITRTNRSNLLQAERDVRFIVWGTSAEFMTSVNIVFAVIYSVYNSVGRIVSRSVPCLFQVLWVYFDDCREDLKKAIQHCGCWDVIRIGFCQVRNYDVSCPGLREMHCQIHVFRESRDDFRQAPKTMTQSNADRKRNFTTASGAMAWGARCVRDSAETRSPARRWSFCKCRESGACRFYRVAAMTRRATSAPPLAGRRRSVAGIPRTTAAIASR